MPHTPGPWVIVYDNEKSPDIAYVRPDNGAYQEIAAFFPNSVADGDYRANAALCAAAPELLMLLEKTLWDAVPEGTKLAANITAAIKRARGEETVEEPR